MKKKAFILALALVLSPLTVFGSGSGGNSGGYDIGKKVFKQKLICDGCPLEGTAMNRKSIKAVLPALAADGEIGKTLSRKEQRAVVRFLKDRYGL